MVGNARTLSSDVTTAGPLRDATASDGLIREHERIFPTLPITPYNAFPQFRHFPPSSVGPRDTGEVRIG